MDEGGLTMGERIAYAIKKKCSDWSLTEWCEEWGFSIEDFEKFLEGGKKEFKEKEE